jgi:uncharacterized protein YlxP (DUF503 family)
MYTLSAKLTFYIPSATSLKQKRQIRRSLVEKAKKRFNLSIAEVDTQDIHQTLTLGIAVVSAEFTHGQNSLEEIIRFMEKNSEAELTSIERL